MIKVNVIGKKQFEKALNDLPIRIKKEVSTNVRDAADQFRDLAIKDAPADVGFLRSKIVVEPQTAGQLKYEVISGSKYSAPMEFGTKSKFQPIPGIDASEFKGQPTGGTFKDLVNNIAKWVRRKGLSRTYSTKTKRRTGNKFDQLAYVIARSIVKNGVSPHPYFYKQFPIVRKFLLFNIGNVIKALLG